MPGKIIPAPILPQGIGPVGMKIDGLIKSRPSRAGGNSESAKRRKRLDSRFPGNDGKERFQTFYEFIRIWGLIKGCLLGREPPNGHEDPERLPRQPAGF